MATALQPGPFAVLPRDRVISEADDESTRLRRSVGPFGFIGLGLGMILGTGIFVIVGEAIGKSGPAIVLSFVLVGVTCIFSALSYAEMATAIPVAGSAYTYAYATLGELIAWIIGWDLILEYGFAVAVVAVGWGGYLQSLLDTVFSIHLPNAISQPPGDGGTVNLPAVVLILCVTAVLLRGARESTRFNAGMVLIKVVVLLFFIVIAFSAFHGSNLKPFAPHGFSGTVDAAALIFFAYIGFDVVSTGGEEARNPGRDLPIGIIGSLGIATIIYILVGLAAVGAAPASKLAGQAAPLAVALQSGAGVGTWAIDILDIGALVAIASVVLALLYGQTRIMFAMCRDGLLPRSFARVSSERRVPYLIGIGFGVAAAVLGAFIPLKTLAELVNIGTLFAFVIVNIGIVWLRRAKPDLKRPFRVPLADLSLRPFRLPVFPALGVILSVYLMTRLAGATWARFFIWMAIGLVIYGVYGYRHSRLRREGVTESPVPSGTAAGSDRERRARA
jgi:APA family basic amino acid/polyamine antiporter